ncbi:hypothetical protein [Wolbachia endosymbiont (group A) of Lasioglossum morio]|uniref:hypothetical protein n=1 Tax=Wolbachia endosymbiont (group A) of Lasioglossum morio TaxID=2954025 RepID=UPI0022274B1B|nr:hypothetical protein [Wolbachia endosymbiont (group A) of Lasioglossum morio]
MVNTLGSHETISKIESEKLKIVNSINSYYLKGILESPEAVNRINSIGTEKLKILVDNIDSCYLKNILGSSAVINSLTIETLKIISHINGHNLKGILESPEAINTINSIGTKKLETISRIKTYINAVLESPEAVNGINSIGTKKLKIISHIDGHNLKGILESPEAINTINSIGTEKLEILVKNVESDRLKGILDNSEIDIKRNLGFAVALFKAGKVNNINSNYLLNSKIICDDVIDYLANELSGKMLPSVVERIVNQARSSQGPVSKLQVSCIEQVIMNTSQHVVNQARNSQEPASELQVLYIEQVIPSQHVLC